MTASLIVVAAALVRAERVLAARRTAPPALAGRWEFPGGKVEPGESDPAALQRECREELHVEITVGPRLAQGPIGPGRELRLYLATLAVPDETGPSWSAAHDELRWLGFEELDELDWLDADRPLVPSVQGWLRGPEGARPAG